MYYILNNNNRIKIQVKKIVKDEYIGYLKHIEFKAEAMLLRL